MSAIPAKLVPVRAPSQTSAGSSPRDIESLGMNLKLYPVVHAVPLTREEHSSSSKESAQRGDVSASSKSPQAAKAVESNQPPVAVIVMKKKPSSKLSFSTSSDGMKIKKARSFSDFFCRPKADIEDRANSTTITYPSTPSTSRAKSNVLPETGAQSRKTSGPSHNPPADMGSPRVKRPALVHASTAPPTPISVPDQKRSGHTHERARRADPVSPRTPTAPLEEKRGKNRHEKGNRVPSDAGFVWVEAKKVGSVYPFPPSSPRSPDSRAPLTPKSHDALRSGSHHKHESRRSPNHLAKENRQRVDGVETRTPHGHHHQQSHQSRPELKHQHSRDERPMKTQHHRDRAQESSERERGSLSRKNAVASRSQEGASRSILEWRANVSGRPGPTRNTTV
ncbi:hypothetical protein JAAARDRAFT_63122 [Jaapia argillacea MUCL 33604]|uniref:Uncharacterized protein n=1 Tax=Jaapia argillacea MUCL 33604 TaxID=933084 RepID=A0A067PHL9_9AGAM|nr:hypothetical protein JAAARDRAFT_63122 [Jaapia argillacea MUCL 33604]